MFNTFITNATADLAIKARPGYVKQIVISNVTVAGTLTLYDSLTETGTILFQVTLAISNVPIVVPLEGNFGTGLFCGFDGTLAGRVAVSWS